MTHYRILIFPQATKRPVRLTLRPPRPPNPQRDAEHRESLSTTLRTLRADSLRQTDNMSRLHERYTEAQRKVNIAEAEDAALRAQLRAAEAAVQKLKEEAARAKKLVAETRAACANEVRKRDRQIDGLKKAVAEAGRARGERRSAGITTIHVVGEVGGEESLRGSAASGGGANNSSFNNGSTMSEDYDLRQETNGFLSQLAKGLSEENETLLSLIRKTNASLKGMSGLEKSEDVGRGSRDSHVVALPTDPEDLAADIENVLGHLRTMLTNPSFVPLEEVVVREQEIFRLRDGWEKMETRWQEAVHLIDSWRRRMAANGRPVDMEDLQMGLRLSPVRVRDVAETAHNGAFKLSTLQEEEEEVEKEEEEEVVETVQEEQMQQKGHVQDHQAPSPAESLHLVPAPVYEPAVPDYDMPNDLDDSDAESSIFQDDVDVDMEDLQRSEPNVEILQHSTDYAPGEDSVSMTLPPPPKITPLEETELARNRKPAGTLKEKSRKRSGDLIDQAADELSEAPTPPPHGPQSRHSPQKRLKVSSDAENEKPSSRPTSEVFNDSNSSLDSILLQPSPEERPVTKPVSKATTRPTRSNTTSKKEDAASSRPAPTTRTTRAVGQKKKETPSKPLTRTRSTRTTASTAPPSARAAISRPEPMKARRANAAGTTADMPPPPRPTTRTRTASLASQKQSAASTAQAEKKSSAADETSSSLAAVDSSASHSTIGPVETPSASTASKRGRARDRDQSSAYDTPTRSPTKSASRLPLPRPLPQPPQQSPITVAGIAAKLAASEREANAVRVRAKLKAARLAGGRNKTAASAVSTTNSSCSGTSTVTSSLRVVSGESAEGDPVRRDRDVSGGSTSLDENGTAGGVSILACESDSAASSLTGARAGDVAAVSAAPTPQRANSKKITRAAEEVSSRAAAVSASPAKKEQQPPRKREVRSRAEKVASRRRSTLSPWELQSLITGDVVPPPTPGAVVGGGDE